MEKVNMNVVGGDGENGLPEKNDLHGGFNGSRKKTRCLPGNDCRETRCCFTSRVVIALKRTSQSW